MGIIMTPKEKAKELFEKFYLCMPFKDVKLTSCDENPELIIDMEKLSAKQCALIAVQIVIDSNPLSPHDGSYYELTEDRVNTAIEYWQQVKTEIELL